MADYPINKGIGHSVEFKGLKAQYLFIFAGGLFAVFFLVVVPIWLVRTNWSASVRSHARIIACMGTFHLNNKYGEHGLMKLLASKSHPRYILNRRKTNRMFKHKRKKNEKYQKIKHPWKQVSVACRGARLHHLQGWRHHGRLRGDAPRNLSRLHRRVWVGTCRMVQGYQRCCPTTASSTSRTGSWKRTMRRTCRIATWAFCQEAMSDTSMSVLTCITSVTCSSPRPPKAHGTPKQFFHLVPWAYHPQGNQGQGNGRKIPRCRGAVHKNHQRLRLYLLTQTDGWWNHRWNGQPDLCTSIALHGERAMFGGHRNCLQVVCVSKQTPMPSYLVANGRPANGSIYGQLIWAIVHWPKWLRLSFCRSSWLAVVLQPYL